MKPVTYFNLVCLLIFLVFISAVIGALNPGCEAGAAAKIDAIYWGFLGSFGVIGGMIMLLALLGVAYYIFIQVLRRESGEDWMALHWKLFGGVTLALLVIVPIIIYVGFHWGFSPIK